MLSSTIQLARLGLRVFVAFVATAFLLSPLLSAQGIGDRIDKVGDRVVDRTKKGVDTRINQRVSKVNSKIDRSIDKALDPKTYKKKRKAAQKAEKEKQKGMTKEERKARKQELKAQDKIERDNRKARKAKEKAEWRAYKAGYQSNSQEEEDLERAAREQQKAAQQEIEAIRFNNFVGSFQYDIRYHSSKIDDDGKETLTAIPEKHYLLSIDAHKGKIVVHSKNPSIGNSPEYVYMTRCEEKVTVNEDAVNEADRVSTEQFYTFNFTDLNKKQFWYGKYSNNFTANDSVFFEGELLASDTIGGVEVTRYRAETDLYKIELWADNSRRLNTIHAFNTACRYSRRRPDLYALQPIHMMRVPVLRARIYHKNTKEVCIMTMQNFSTNPPHLSAFNYPTPPVFNDLSKQKDVEAMPLQDAPNYNKESAEWRAYLEALNATDAPNVDLNLGDMNVEAPVVEKPAPTPAPVVNPEPAPKTPTKNKKNTNKPK